MQNTVIMAFRKRLLKRGYSQISIKKTKTFDVYKISAVEPLNSVLIVVDYTFDQMYRAFRF